VVSPSSNSGCCEVHSE